MRKRDTVWFEGEELKLGQWLSTEKRRKGTRTLDQITRMESIGFKYNT